MDNLNIEKQKLDYLAFLKAQQTPGPFTDPESVQHFMKNEPDGKEKNERLYREVRFQRNSSQTLKKDDSVFCLRKQHKNLESKEYAANLRQFLNQSRSVSNLTMGDLCNVLTGLNGVIAKSSNVVCDVPDNIKMPDFECGEHVVCVWHDEQENVVYATHRQKRNTTAFSRGGRNSENWPPYDSRKTQKFHIP